MSNCHSQREGEVRDTLREDSSQHIVIIFKWLKCGVCNSQSKGSVWISDHHAYSVYSDHAGMIGVILQCGGSTSDV